MLAPLLDRRELRDLWVSIAIAISLAVYHLCFSLVGTLQYLSMEYARFVNNIMFFWILGLLWVAYRRYLDAVSRQKELHNILTSISTEVIMVADTRRRVRMANESVSLFGYTVAEVLMQPTDLLYFDRRIDDKNPHEVRDAVERVGFHMGRATGRKRDGTTFPLEIMTAALKGNEGVVLVVKDITERQRAEEAILRAKEQAEAANVAKGKMLAELDENYAKLRETESMRDNLTHMIVHDMRTPLQVVLSNLELVERLHRRTGGREDEKPMLSEAMLHAQVLADMANTVLDVSRLESHRFPLQKTAWDFATLADESIATLAPSFRDLRVRCDKPDGALVVEADREIIRRVVGNLLGNAFKYSPPDSEVVVSLEQKDGHVRFAVKDAGPGIAPEDQQKIFEKFGQGGTRPLRKTHGAGIGLAFCRLAVEAHGGAVGVNSELGKGASFWFEIPVGTSAGAAAS
jgi:PAS domain S-box-containing protein